MAKDLYYRQCFLRRQDEDTVVEQVSYVPEPFCVPGKALKLRKGDVGEDGWVVLSAGEREPRSSGGRATTRRRGRIPTSDAGGGRPRRRGCESGNGSPGRTPERPGGETEG
jgi:hypothetical protein